VEDSLATLDHYHEAAVDESSAVNAAQHTLDLSMQLYVKGAIDYLTVVTSQTAVLQTQLEALAIDTTRLRASVDLIRALGGGWQSPTGQPPTGQPATRGVASSCTQNKPCRDSLPGA